MRFIIKFLLIGAIIYALQLYFPWWVIMAVPFVINAVIKTKGAAAFFSGFLAVFLLWLGMAYFIHTNTGGIVTARMSALLPLRNNQLLLILLTALAGGIAGGVSAYAGNAFRNLFISPAKKTNRSGYGRPDYRFGR